MIPDNFLGGLTMTLVNITVVFLVLGFLAVVIEVVHRLIARLQIEPEVVLPRKQVLVVASQSEPEEGEVFLPDDIDPAKKAVILAAISVYIGRPEASMFLRDKKDTGSWGRSSGRRPFGLLGSYRSAQLAKDRQLSVSAK